jgi:hypothetical protein
MPTPSRHVDLALCSEDMAIIAMSCKAALLVSYLELYLSYLQWWLREWRIAISISKSTTTLFPKAGWHIQKP